MATGSLADTDKRNTKKERKKGRNREENRLHCFFRRTYKEIQIITVGKRAIIIHTSTIDGMARKSTCEDEGVKYPDAATVVDVEEPVLAPLSKKSKNLLVPQCSDQGHAAPPTEEERVPNTPTQPRLNVKKLTSGPYDHQPSSKAPKKK